MTDLVLIPLGLEFLALTPAEMAQARDRAREILGAGWAGVRGASAVNGDAPEYLCTAEEMEERTKVGASWFLEQARLGRVPHHRLGKYVRFRFDEVLVCSRFRERGK